MIREVVFGVLLPILLPVFMGLDDILYTFPVADVLTSIIAAFIVTMMYQQLKQPVCTAA